MTFRYWSGFVALTSWMTTSPLASKSFWRAAINASPSLLREPFGLPPFPGWNCQGCKRFSCLFSSAIVGLVEQGQQPLPLPFFFAMCSSYQNQTMLICIDPRVKYRCLLHFPLDAGVLEYCMAPMKKAPRCRRATKFREEEKAEPNAVRALTFYTIRGRSHASDNFITSQARNGD